MPKGFVRGPTRRFALSQPDVAGALSSGHQMGPASESIADPTREPTYPRRQLMSLYATLLGSAWTSLAPAIRYLHAGRVRARGQFRVRRGAGLAARVISAILGMPTRGEGIPVTLAVEPTEVGETWTRAFGERRFRTLQWSKGALLVEAFGLVQCVFRLRAEGGVLVFDQLKALLGIRRFALALPRFLAPRVEGRAEARGDAVYVDVSIRAPVVGLLVAYDGCVAVDPDPSQPFA